MTRLQSSAGNTVVLGRQLGRGGEGSVYEIAGRPGFVAKIYHQPLNTERILKLEGMVRQTHPSLQEISAWPVDVLHTHVDGAVCGFVMRRLSGYHEIHNLYGPAHRKRIFPHADWSFLVHAARNLSSAFETIHAHNHIIGDVNPGNVVVSTQALIRLIDCDSFQISADNQLFPCNVGVLQFTAPELQERSFYGLKRTPNHDNFGLAVLCFHLLFMGRHPFAGRYRGKGDMPIEQAIKEFRFAFGRFAPIWSMDAPPHSLSMDVLPEAVANLFERAFAPPDPNRGRPTAQQWLKALEKLGANLCVCHQNRDHKYPKEQKNCPWCLLEQEGGTRFFASLVSTSDLTTPHHFDLEGVWKRVLAITPPDRAIAPQPADSEPMEPIPLPASLKRVQRGNWIRMALVVTTLWLAIVMFPLLAWLWLPLALAAWMLIRGNAVRQEYQRRRQVLLAARRERARLQGAWQQRASEQPFLNKRHELNVLYERHKALSAEHRQALQDLETHRYQNQLRTFLEGYFIHTADLVGIHTTDRMVLASYGIETAADIAEDALRSVPGFGHHLGRQRLATLLSWRQKLERGFRYNPNQNVAPAAINMLHRRYAQQQHLIEQELLKGSEVLSQIKADILKQRVSLGNALLRQVMQEAQARADLKVFYPDLYMLLRKWRD
ncbi:MAG: hypothetical protein CSA09_02510 [Candidatus Contendobacter odensis]|uniref:Protein kinase domain-containing protein n=1 Tax=Candidatus Contendibacter odensensis TaxID=1400860 RepID=A0A2G6PGI7_9GAMM|nr:MAG: hypothetical protein CSA09_02510 [Candidatus Contendobacter odensis]